MQDVSNNFGIPRSTLKEHYVGKRKSRKIKPKGVLTMAEEASLVQYLEEMVRVSCPLNITQLKLKVAEITQTRMTPFTHGIPGKSWIKWFRQRHPNLVLRFPQPLDLNRARALCPQTVEQFYHNLESLYQQHNYETSQVWNCDESGAQANKNGEGAILALRGTRSVHAIIPNERQWISVLVSVNSAGHTMPSYYVFKGKRQRQEFISSCENGAYMGMQENGYMDAAIFNKWMDYFLNYHESRGNLSLTKRMLLILDGHKSHVTLEVLQKANAHGLDMVSLPSHTSHALQPLDISCFKPFKQSFRAYRDA